ncbi:MAG: hypothetical protein MUF42_01825 [Cytophagaceae bacterium]|nr:hypothetical protein [Cytophagaceae bacterium]
MRIFLLPVVLLLSGCFEVIEDLTLDPTGSGRISITVNLSQSKGKIASLMLLDTLHGKKVPKQDDIIAKLEEAKNIAMQSPGISQVSIDQDYKNFIFVFKCHFTHVDALNKVIDKLSRHFKLEKYVLLKHPHFTYLPAKQEYIRNADYFTTLEYQKLRESERNVLEKGMFISVTKFQKRILHCSNRLATMAPSGTAVMIKTSAASCLKKTNSISNKVQLQP